MKYIDIRPHTLKDYRQKQLDNAIFNLLITDIKQAQTLPKDLRRKISENWLFPTIAPATQSSNSNDTTLKVLFKTQRDQKTFESVLLRHQDGRRTVCLSTQIGCSLNCRFCATGQMQFIRNLDYREIVDQVLFFERLLKKSGKHVTNIVYMGMGEPFLNPINTTNSVNILNDPAQFGLGSRNFTMSSVGIIEPMKKFFEKHDQINLAISLHSAKPDLRRKLMPAASQVSLEEIADYIELHINKYNRRVSLEYTLLQNVNDQESDIDALIEFFEQIGKHARKLLHINLIPYNPINDSSYKPSDFDTIKEFQKALSDNNIQVTIRKSLGQENKAACGMLKTANSKE